MTYFTMLVYVCFPTRHYTLTTARTAIGRANSSYPIEGVYFILCETFQLFVLHYGKLVLPMLQ